MSPMEVFRETMEGDTAMRDKIRESILCYSVSLGVRNSGTVCLAISGAEIVFTSKYTHHGPVYRSVICDTYNRAVSFSGEAIFGILYGL